MPGRFAGPFNLFRDANTKERLVKNYAAKLLANAERIVDRPGGSQFQKLVSQHGDLLFTAMVDKTGPRPIYRVHVSGIPIPYESIEVEEVIPTPCSLLSGLYSILGYAIDAPIVDSDIAEQEGYTEFNDYGDSLGQIG